MPVFLPRETEKYPDRGIVHVFILLSIWVLFSSNRSFFSPVRSNTPADTKFSVGPAGSSRQDFFYGQYCFTQIPPSAVFHNQGVSTC